METEQTTFNEFEFKASDIDNGDTIVDIVMVKQGLDVSEAIIQHINRERGNRWLLDSYKPTGKRMLKTVTYVQLSARLDHFAEKEYPTRRNN